MISDETREEAVERPCGCDPQVRLERALTTITNLGQIADDSLDDARRIATEALRGASVPEESVALQAEVERLRGVIKEARYRLSLMAKNQPAIYEDWAPLKDAMKALRRPIARSALSPKVPK